MAAWPGHVRSARDDRQRERSASRSSSVRRRRTRGPPRGAPVTYKFMSAAAYERASTGRDVSYVKLCRAAPAAAGACGTTRNRFQVEVTLVTRYRRYGLRDVAGRLNPRLPVTWAAVVGFQHSGGAKFRPRGRRVSLLRYVVRGSYPMVFQHSGARSVPVPPPTAGRRPPAPAPPRAGPDRVGASGAFS